jgi:hypothetical protein
MAIHAIVGGIELTLQEPRIVSASQGPGVDGLEVPGPGQELSRALCPELVWLGDGFLVELVVFIKA